MGSNVECVLRVFMELHDGFYDNKAINGIRMSIIFSLVYVWKFHSVAGRQTLVKHTESVMISVYSVLE